MVTNLEARMDPDPRSVTEEEVIAGGAIRAKIQRGASYISERTDHHHVLPRSPVATSPEPVLGATPRHAIVPNGTIVS